MNHAVLVEALAHRYGEREALRGVSFAVEKGEIFGLLGPNGGGKTTLFRILATLLRPSGGSARIFGTDVVRERDRVLPRLGVVFQSPSLDKKLTAAENLRHHGHLYGIRGRELTLRTREMLARVGLEERADELVERLSGGQRRRVEVAKSLLHRPELLLLDEPSTGLDPGARRDLVEQLRRLRAQHGVTVLLTTHIMEEAEACDRIGILHQGRLVAIGTPDALKERIGGDVITVGTQDAAQLAAEIQARFGGAPTVLDGPEPVVRVERPRAHEFVAALVEAFPGRIGSVRLGKATLEDVFIHETGHRFWEDETAPAGGPTGRGRAGAGHD
jgi:ABC-2 type transport system ATP-binding protein